MNHDDFNLPNAYIDEGQNELDFTLREYLQIDAPGLTNRTVQYRTRALDVFIPICENAAVFSLDQLAHFEGLRAVRESLTQTIQSSDFAAATWETRISQFVVCCESANMTSGDLKRLRQALNMGLKDARLSRVIEPEVTDEHIQQLAAEMTRWRDCPLEKSGSNGCRETLVGIRGNRDRSVTPIRRDRALAFIAITWATGSRTGDVRRLTRGDIKGSKVRLQVAKGNTVQPEDILELDSYLLHFVKPLLKRLGNKPNEPLFPSESVTGDVRSILLASGWPEHFGRTGLHRLRKVATRWLYEAGESIETTAAVLNNSVPVVERSYSTQTRDARKSRGRERIQSRRDELLAPAPTWRWPSGDEPTPWAMLATSSWITNPTSASELVTRAGENALAQVSESLGLDSERVRELVSDLPDDELRPELSGAWRLRWVEVESDPDSWNSYPAAESSVGDVVILAPGSETVWLNKGQLHHQAMKTAVSQFSGQRENPGSNPGTRTSLESIIPNTAATIRQALQDGDEEVAFALLDLLTALGGQPI